MSRKLRYYLALSRAAFYLFSLIVLTAVAVHLTLKHAPPQHNPFRALSVNHPIGLATESKLKKFRSKPEACFAALDEGGIEYTSLEDTYTTGPCGFRDALTLDQSMVPYSATLSMTCPLTAALAVWERQVVAPAALEILGTELTGIETFGSFACRRINNAPRGRFSEHATGNAIDISGFRLSDGRTVRVLGNWKKGTPESDFLLRIREGACEVFSVVLSPDYNALHADHFHFDFGSGNVCR